MKIKLKNIKISHIIAGLPKKKISVHDFEPLFGKKQVERISNSTGIEYVHYAEDDLCASDYGVILAQKLMEETELSGKDFDGIVFISQTPDYIMPATSVIMQDRLGLPKTSVAFDINSGCNGYVYGLYQASLLISSGSCKRVLLFNGDTKSRLVYEKDRTTRMVMGDGFSVTLIIQGNDELCFNIHSDGNSLDHVLLENGGARHAKSLNDGDSFTDDIGYIHYPNYIFMNGMKMMNFILDNVPNLIKETLEFVGWSKEDVGAYAMHQVNQMILKTLSEKLEIPLDHMPIALKDMGNTGSASVPLMLSMKHKELEEQKLLSKVMICGYGIGLSWGAVALDLSETMIHDTLTI